MITKKDILPLNEFEHSRDAIREKTLKIKNDRRVHIGPDITLYFENKNTLLWQIHEMLRIEKGGDEQLIDELEAYAPLCPKKSSSGTKSIVFTMMVEIIDPDERRVMLQKLNSIEQKIVFSCNNTELSAQVINDNVERTNDAGKTSSIHFLKVEIPSSFEESIRKHPLSIKINHPYYNFSHELLENQKTALIEDLENVS